MRVGLAVLMVSSVLAGCQATGGLSVWNPDSPAVDAAAPNTPNRNLPNELGRAHLSAGNYGLAERQFRDAVEKNPDDAASWVGLAAAYDNLGRFDLADRAYEQAARTGGETLELINNLGYSYLLRGDGARARVQFERALSLDPANAVVANNIKLLRLGQRGARGLAL
jgi:Flp pilus assembly protein TadD